MIPLGRTRNTAAISDVSWDVIVLGGGIMGAGVFREASRRSLRVLLVERGDFASGTSSRSSKLVHGGLRYLAQGKIGFVRRSIRARNELLREARGLVDPLEFCVALREEEQRTRTSLRVGLWAYDMLSGSFPRRRALRREGLEGRIPCLGAALQDGFQYEDAQTDDARLVLRVLREGCEMGGEALNYVTAEGFIRDESGRVAAVRMRDLRNSHAFTVAAQAVVNATGPWAGDLVEGVLGPGTVRHVRGAHLILPAGRLPLSHAVVGLHPVSGLPVFLTPWEGVTLVGTTHDEVSGPIASQSRATTGEVGYLLEGVRALFPALGIRIGDVQATFSGVRAIADSRTRHPGSASRDHVIAEHDKVVTVLGGKLTTFQAVACEVVNQLRKSFPRMRGEHLPPISEHDMGSVASAMSDPRTVRLRARYGERMAQSLFAGPPTTRSELPGTGVLMGELQWAARYEQVEHLDDLLLRRLRIGLTLPRGAMRHLEGMREVIQSATEWSDERWDEEVMRYRRIWTREHGPPDRREQGAANRYQKSRPHGSLARPRTN